MTVLAGFVNMGTAATSELLPRQGVEMGRQIATPRAVVVAICLLAFTETRVAGHQDRLCLSQVDELALPDGFTPMGVATSVDPGLTDAIATWSRSSLLLLRTVPGTVDPRIVSRIELADIDPDIDPLSIALLRSQHGEPVVQLLDVHHGAVWNVDPTTKQLTRTATPAGSIRAAGATRDEHGWVWAEKAVDLVVDTSTVILSRKSNNTSTDRRVTLDPLDEPQHGISRKLHVRLNSRGGVLVQEAGFPFSTIRFTSDGDETWRATPEPAVLREVLEESDLRYVMATPAVAVDGAVLNTFVALRSRLRVSALREVDNQGDSSFRYRRIPSDLAFLAVLPERRLLIGVQGAVTRRVAFFEWRWIDQRESCTPSP
jgi:hypothetical protein